jgi:hypothetical protein
MIVNLYFIFKYKNYAAVNGGIEAVSSLMPSQNYASTPNSGFLPAFNIRV